MHQRGVVDYILSGILQPADNVELLLPQTSKTTLINAKQTKQHNLYWYLPCKVISKHNTKVRYRCLNQDKAFNILFNNKSSLIDDNNIIEMINLLLIILKCNDLNILWKNNKIILNLFEYLCFCLKLIENENNENNKNYTNLVSLTNCCIIDILSSVPICNNNENFVLLLNILKNYKSEKILINSQITNCINIDDLPQKIGQSIIMNFNEFIKLISYLSNYSKCLI